MTRKEKFVNFIEKEIFSRADIWYENYPEDWEDICTFWETFKGKEEKDKPLFTDNGKLILKFLQENIEIPAWKAKDIAEGLFISSRTVSGSIRKLVTDGYVEKVSQDPVIYSLTEAGKNIIIE